MVKMHYKFQMSTVAKLRQFHMDSKVLFSIYAEEVLNTVKDTEQGT